ncbi:MAG: nitroreductase [Deltaproteobacteria bacterium]|nr:nitroreductase [Deltaproteobacteria bacterium]
MSKILIITAIQKRYSCRTFNPKSIEREKVEALENILQGNTQGPFGAKLRFRLVDFKVMSKEEIRACGTYGVIRGASHFIVGAVHKGAGALEDFGYGMERNILQAQALGLCTCWLGGTFRRTGFSDRIGLRDNELLPAVAPVGYGADKRSFADRVIRFGAGSDKRKPWEVLFFDREFHALKKEAAGPYALPLECIRLGPSASNKQPWRIVQEEHLFHFYLEQTPGYAGSNGEVKLQHVDMGIAMSHFELASRELGMEGRWMFADPGMQTGSWEYVATWTAVS